MTKRKEFSAKVKVAAWDRAGGRCEICTAKLFPGNQEYDHRIPDASGGDASLANVQVLCRSCHRNKTSKSDVPAIAKGKRVRRRHIGVRKASSFRGWRRMNGDAVHAKDSQ